ncbi:hypothetical protein KY362_05275 [Candidatus Woesearchaeota archaeon]|nr:hypothetical protein [Candidatus Woesearchaeota archaeon]
MKYFQKAVTVLIILVLLVPNALAWARHDQMTSEVVRDLGWLDRFDSVTVNEYHYSDPTISETVLRYDNKDPKFLGPEDYFYHALYEKAFFFTGSPVGGTTDAKQILSDFSDEPDWEIDQNLQLSWMQAFHGESQGYRHIYYPTGSFHIPMGLIGQGGTPERVQHFYDLAKAAFENGDTYWGFRFLARSLHYVQDMSQPYHTRQFYWRYVQLEDPFYGTIQTIKNYHFAYESYQANLFRLERYQEAPPRMVSAIRYSLPVEVNNPEDFAKYIARRSHWRSSKTWKYSIDFLGERHLTTQGTRIDKEEFFELTEREDEAAEMFHDDLERRMVLFGKATKSFLEYARRDLNLDQYQP